MQCSAVQCSAVQFSAVQCSVLQCVAVQYRAYKAVDRHATGIPADNKRKTANIDAARAPHHFTLYGWVTNICRRLNTATVRAASTVLLARVYQVGSGLPDGVGSSSGGRKERFRTPVVQTFWCTALTRSKKREILGPLSEGHYGYGVQYSAV